MSYAGVLATVNLYTAQKDELTSEISDIMMEITSASKQTTQISEDYSDARKDAKESFKDESLTNREAFYEGYSDATEYEQAILDDLKSDYECKLANVNDWEAELEAKKQTLQTEVQAASATLESYTSVLKSNIKRDFTYGKGTSG
ncbi:MAG: hypothetical protein WCY19_05500 [Candidatus Gastranaerophilaceae bacterium]